MDRSFLDDAAAISAMVAGDPVGLESVYRRYADRLYGYARSIVGDDDTAADVVQETFLLAHERVRQLREPDRLSSWLYAIARNQCLAKLRARKRTVTLAESHEPVLDTDPGRAVHAAQVRELVHSASSGMNEGDREVFELTVRHGLSAADVARVLDISDKHAHARISRARAQFEGALGALVLARDGRGHCDQLDSIVRDWDGQLTALLRKRIERHARDCGTCLRRRQERMNPAALLASYATLPFLAVAATLWPRVATAVGVGSAAAAPGAVPPDVVGPSVGPQPGGPPSHGADPAAGSPTPVAAGPPPGFAPGAPTGGGPSPIVPGRPTGFAPGAPTGGGPSPIMPGPPTGLAPGAPGGGAPRGGNKKSRVVVAATLVVLLIIAGAAVVALLTRQRPAATGTFATASTSTSPSPPPLTSSPSAPPTTQTQTTPPAPPPPPPPFTLSASGELCAPDGELTVTASASVPLEQARVFYAFPPGTAPDDRAMMVSGSTAQIAFTRGTPTPEIEWWVVAESTDGRTRETPHELTFGEAC